MLFTKSLQFLYIALLVVYAIVTRDIQSSCFSSIKVAAKHPLAFNNRNVEHFACFHFEYMETGNSRNSKLKDFSSCSLSDILQGAVNLDTLTDHMNQLFLQVTTRRINFIVDTTESNADRMESSESGVQEKDHSWLMSSLHQIYSRR